MRLLAIDPGPRESAYVCWDTEKSAPLMIHWHGANEAVLSSFYAPSTLQQLVIERISHYGTGMPAGQSVFDTSHWSGRFHQAWLDAGHPENSVFLVKRASVKAHLCGSVRAKDSNVRQALIDRYGEPGTKKAPGALYGVHGDVWQALALAVAFAEGVR